MKDNHGRKIDYIRISVTDLCNLRCKYCMPEKGVEKKQHFEIISFEEIENIIRAGVSLGIKKVRLTGGEPLVRKGIVSLVEKIRSVSQDIDIAMTTNAVLLSKYAGELKEAGLNRVNISLDTLKKDKYKDITRGGDISEVFKGIEAAKKNGLFPIKMNVVLIRGFNSDEIDDFVDMTIKEDIEIRFIELMPFGQNAYEYSENKYISNEEILKSMPQLEKTEDKSSRVCKYYRMPKAKGKIGLISPTSGKFCDKCNRIRITSDAKIKPCLHSNEEIDIREMVIDGYSYEEILKVAMNNKPEMHKLDERIFTSREMNRIGG